MKSCTTIVKIDEYSDWFCSLIINKLIYNPHYQIPLCRAYVYKTKSLNDGTTYVTGEYVAGIYLTIFYNDSSNGIFIPLREFQKNSLQTIIKAVRQYFTGILKRKQCLPLPLVFPDYNVFLGNLDRYLLRYSVNSLVFSNNISFKNLKDAFNYARHNLNKSQYSIVSKDSIYYIEISTYDGRKIYVKINKRISLAMWLSLKFCEHNSYSGYFDGEILNDGSKSCIPINVNRVCSFEKCSFKMVGPIKRYEKNK